MGKGWQFKTNTDVGADGHIDGHYWAAQAQAVADSGNVSATVVIEATNMPLDSGSWQTLATLTIASAATPQRAIAQSGSTPIGWDRVRARCTAISGTNAVVNVVFNSL